MLLPFNTPAHEFTDDINMLKYLATLDCYLAFNLVYKVYIGFIPKQKKKSRIVNGMKFVMVDINIT